MAASWTVSVISHGHGDAIVGVVSDLYRHLQGRPFEIILTLNIPEPQDPLRDVPQPIRQAVQVRHNANPLGFGANHNAALANADSDYIAVADPDLRIPEDIFAPLEALLQQDGIGIASPRAYDKQGYKEDNGRLVNTPWSMLLRQLRGRRKDAHRIAHATRPVEWLAGLFMAMKRETFQALNGFDTGYFMYAEDTDLCLRAHIRGWRSQLDENLRIIHPARRKTFRNPRHLIWHIASLLRLWRSPAYRQFRSSMSSRRN